MQKLLYTKVVIINITRLAIYDGYSDHNIRYAPWDYASDKVGNLRFLVMINTCTIFITYSIVLNTFYKMYLNDGYLR